MHNLGAAQSSADIAPEARIAALLDVTAWWSLVLAVALVPVVIVSPLSSDGPVLARGDLFIKAIVLSVLASASAAALGLRWLLGTNQIRWHRVFGLVGAVFAWIVFCTAMSVSPATSLIGARMRSGGLITVTAYLAVFALTAMQCISARRLRLLLDVMVSAAGFVAAYGWIQVLGLDPISWSTDWGGRAFGSVANPDLYGTYLVIGALLAFALFRAETIRTRRALYGAALVVVGSGLYLSHSRGALLGATVGVAVFFAWRPPRWRFDALAIAVTIALVAALSLGAYLGASDGGVDDVARTVSAPRDPSVKGRLLLWQTAASAAIASPIWGNGPDTFFLVSQYRVPEALARLSGDVTGQDSPHNFALKWASEYGFVGLGLWIWLLVTVAVTTARGLKELRSQHSSYAQVGIGMWAAAAGYLCAALFSPSTISGWTTFFALIGLLVAPYLEPRTVRRRSVLRAVGVVATALAFSFMATDVVRVAADAQAAVARNRGLPLDRRRVAAERALALNPLSTEYHAIAALVWGDEFLALGDTAPSPERSLAASRSVAFAREAVERQPGDPGRRTLLISRLLLVAPVQAEALQEARVVAEQARKDFPFEVHTMYWDARVRLALQDLRGAEALLVQAADTAPTFTEASLLLADTRLRMGDARGAATVLRAAQEYSDDPRVAQLLGVANQMEADTR